jgi:hypothetical protein
LTHTATTSNEHGLELKIDADGMGDIKGIDIIYDTGAIATGEDEGIILINIDESDATGGDVIGLEIISTEGSANIYGLEAGVLVNPILQLSGTFENMDSVDNNGDDDLAEFTSTASDVNIFVNDNDYVTIGDEDKFEEIEFLLDTTANINIKPIFYFSTGETTWSTFSPTDGTNGLENNGVIAWLDEDIPTWATSGGDYLIRINRTRNNLVTIPKEDKVQISSATKYFWDKNADLFIRNINGTKPVFTDWTDVVITESQISDLSHFNSSYVPYTGATQNLDLGSYDLLAEAIWLAKDKVLHLGTYTTLYNTNSEVIFMNIVTSIPFRFDGYSLINFTDTDIWTEGNVTADYFFGSGASLYSVNETDPFFTAENSSLWTEAEDKYNSTYDTHLSSDGTDHTYIDQPVTTTSNTTHHNLTLTGDLGSTSVATNEIIINNTGTADKTKLSVGFGDVTPTYSGVVEFVTSASNKKPSNINSMLSVVDYPIIDTSLGGWTFGGNVWEYPEGSFNNLNAKNFAGLYGAVVGSLNLDDAFVAGSDTLLTGLYFTSQNRGNWTVSDGAGTSLITTKGIEVQSYLGYPNSIISGTTADAINIGADITATMAGIYNASNDGENYGVKITVGDSINDASKGDITSYGLHVTVPPNASHGGGGNLTSFAIYSPSDVESYLEGSLSVKDLVDRTPAFEGTPSEALQYILDIESEDGEIKHSSLPDLARVKVHRIEEYNCENKVTITPTGENTTERICEYNVIEEEGRSISGMVTLLTDSIKGLKQENDLLKSELCQRDITYSWCEK